MALVSAENSFQKRIDIIGEQLQAKIRSKVQASTFLAGFAATLLGIEMERLWQNDSVPRFLFLSIPLMLGAASLYIYAVLKLDALTTPKPFWGQGFNEVAKWSKCDLEDLGHEMDFYWTRLTVVATCSVGVSLFAMLVPPMLVPLTRTNPPNLLLWTFVGSAISIVVVFIYCAYQRHKAKKTWENQRFSRLQSK